MRQSLLRRRQIIALLLVILLGAVWTGCTVRTKGAKEGRTESSKSESRGTAKLKYYHFDDIPIPEELNYKPDKSFVYETPRFKTGLLVFSKFWLDSDSLVDFFTYYMEKDNWKLVNSYKGKESILNFSKPDKACTIKITEKWTGSTKVEVRVGPLGEKKM